MGISMFTGVSGMLAHQSRLDVIANNIANINTPGYRGSRAVFQDLFSQTFQGAKPPSTASGGTNPIQVGLGARMGGVDVSFVQGSLQTTGFASDLAIQGRGFFVLSNDPTKQEMYFTRDGSFQLDASGQLVDPATGLGVQGYLVDPATGLIDETAGIQDLVVPVGSASIVRATTTADLVGNLDSTTAATGTVVRNLRVFDSLGTIRDIEVTFTKTAVANQWSWAAAPASGSTGFTITGGTGTGTILFTGAGVVTTGGSGTIGLTFAAGDTQPDALSMTVDFSAITQLSGTSDVLIQNQNGLGRGVLEAFNVGQDGFINGVYSNGLSTVIGQVALANFSNEGGLVRWGQNLFISSSNSGLPGVGIPNTGGRGDIAGGTLEMSNVDLGTEFTNLILTQRGFQANSRTVSTADTLLQETVNLIR